jgi:cation diffusion facilitator CzcD-associated flavoprotein CzcO
VTYLDKASGTQETLTPDYVVISTGLYCSPNIPEYKVGGKEALHCFEGHAKADARC